MNVYQKQRGNEVKHFILVTIRDEGSGPIAQMKKANPIEGDDEYTWPSQSHPAEMLPLARDYAATNTIELRVALDNVEWDPEWGILAD